MERLDRIMIDASRKNGKPAFAAGQALAHVAARVDDRVYRFQMPDESTTPQKHKVVVTLDVQGLPAEKLPIC